MTPSHRWQDFDSLLNRILDGLHAEDDVRRLNDILRSDAEARRYYTSYVGLHGQLVWENGTRAPADIERSARDAAVVSAPTFIAEAFNGTVGYFSSGWPLAYLIATVIVGLGILGASLFYVSTHDQLAKSRNSLPAAHFPLPTAVARVTGMIDVEFSDLKTATFSGASVSVGRKYALAAGLMELSYDSGAKVILQGPCEYEVASAAGGYLAVGKLTARVEKKVVSGQWLVASEGERGEGRGESTNNQKSEIINQKSLATKSLSPDPCPLFYVQTPTATVTDLGTEFGVEVQETGSTEAHVFVGKVLFSTQGATVGNGVREQVLIAGQAAKVGDNTKAIRVIASDKKQFVRKMSAATAEIPELIGQIDYCDTWTVNSPTRAGSYLRVENDNAPALQVERCNGNPQRSWTFSRVPAITTLPFDKSPVPWPGHNTRGSKSGLLEAGGALYFGLEYGLRDDFVVQFDAVQTPDRISVTVGEKPAVIDDDQSFSVFIRAAGTAKPEIGVYTPSKGEVDAKLSSGLHAALQWHNYAVRFMLPEKRVAVWVDYQYLGTVDLNNIAKTNGKSGDGPWAGLSLTNRCVTVGGWPGHLAINESRVWTDNFRIGSPRNSALPVNGSHQSKR